MNSSHPFRLNVPSISDETDRPLWSVMIPTYNCAKYLRKTLESVLAQDPGSEMMQIEVVDDCSTKDDPAKVVEEVGQGRVSFYQQPKNLGQLGNFNTCLQRSRGKLIHLLHGDDYVLHGFYKKMQAAFEVAPEIGAAFCRHVFMDETGEWQAISQLLQKESGVIENWLEKILIRQYVQTPSIVVRRNTYEQMGAFDKRLCYYEDWEMWVRISTTYPVWYETETLAAYRMHSVSTSGRKMQTGENIQDVRRGLEIVQSYLPNYLPEDKIKQLINKNREYTAISALRNARIQLQAGNFRTGIVQTQEALQSSTSPRVLAHLGRNLIMLGAHQLASLPFFKLV